MITMAFNLYTLIMTYAPAMLADSGVCFCESVFCTKTGKTNSVAVSGHNTLYCTEESIRPHLNF